MTTKKLLYILLGAFGTGLTQFSFLFFSGVTDTLQLVAGVAGAIGAGITLHVTHSPMPRKKWPAEKKGTPK